MTIGKSTWPPVDDCSPWPYRAGPFLNWYQSMKSSLSKILRSSKSCSIFSFILLPIPFPFLKGRRTRYESILKNVAEIFSLPTWDSANWITAYWDLWSASPWPASWFWSQQLVIFEKVAGPDWASLLKEIGAAITSISLSCIKLFFYN